MTMPTLHELWDSNDGKLPSYAWPGGYPIIYISSDGEVFCPDCANRQNGADTRLTDGPDDPPNDGWRIDGWSIHWEGDSEICCHCNTEIESAYGIPD